MEILVPMDREADLSDEYIRLKCLMFRTVVNDITNEFTNTVGFLLLIGYNYIAQGG